MLQFLGPRSAHGKTQKHHYYDHPRTLMGNGTGHVHKCRIQRLRAPRVEELVLTQLKIILNDPTKINEAVTIYHKERSKNKPIAIHGLKVITDELKTLETKQNNLITRISELPPKISAEPFYKQLTLVQSQINEKSTIKNTLILQSNQESREKVLPSELSYRINRTVKALEKASPEKQRGIFENLIQFAEFHPTKIKLGVYTTARAAKSSPRSSSIESSCTIKMAGTGR